MNTVPVPKVDIVKRKSALGVTWKNLPLTLGFAANNPVWDFDCRECKTNGYVAADAIKLEPVSTQTVSGLYFIHNDHLGTPKLITNISGTIVWQQHTTPFGEIQETIATGINNLKSFPGQYRDSETGYSYNYFRDYDASLGRYVQSDPIGLQGGLNTYGYALGNPVVGIDPWGLSTVLIFTTEYNPNRDPANPWGHVASYAQQYELQNCTQSCDDLDIQIHDVTDVSQINNQLVNNQDISAVYIIGHAKPPSLNIGNADAPNTNISTMPGKNNVHPNQLYWGNLSSNANIYLYGCNTANKYCKGRNSRKKCYPSIMQGIGNASGANTVGTNTYLNFYDDTGQPFFNWHRPWGEFQNYNPNN